MSVELVLIDVTSNVSIKMALFCVTVTVDSFSLLMKETARILMNVQAIGGFRCECLSGFQLNSDQITCSGKFRARPANPT